MERLHQCSDLQQRLERELASIKTATISQSESQQILMRLARNLGISAAVTNLFALPEPLTVPEYILFVRERVAEFAPVDIQAALEQAEAGLNDSPAPRSFGQLASELSQWHKDNDAVVARPPPPEGDTDADSGGDSGDESGEEEDAPGPSVPRNDNDSGSDAEEEDPAPAPVTEDAMQFCERLLQDPGQLSKFSRELYDIVNVRGDSKVDLSQIQPFLDYLVNHHFDTKRLRSIINSLANREFAQIRELNYVKFCVFVRYVLQRYGA
jgi:hypothetical protein